MAEERWKLDVNDRYQRAVATIISLSTVSLASPIWFLKNVIGVGEKPIVSQIGWSAYVGVLLLAVSVISGILYYYFSAKWVKLALVGYADILGIPAKNGFVEGALDWIYLLMMVGFVAGAGCMLVFMATYVAH